MSGRAEPALGDLRIFAFVPIGVEETAADEFALQTVRSANRRQDLGQNTSAFTRRA
jgi:hypothetical protein